MSSATYIAAACAIIGAILIYMEVRRTSRMKVFRIAASGLMMVALYFILTKEERLVTTTGMVVITPGTPDSVETKLRRQFDNRKIIEVSDQQPYGLVNENIPDSVLITGDGLLTSSDIDQLSEVNVRHIIPELPQGIISIVEPDSYTVNSPSTVEIFVSESIDLLLITDGSKSDTINVGPDGYSSFNVIQKVAGPVIYEISGLDESGKALFVDEFPVQVSEARQLSVAMLSSFPLAELNYLKNHLGSAGHQVTSSIRLSTDLYSWDFINTEINKSTITNRLEDFDAIFTTTSYLNTISRVAAGRIASAVENGLGLFIWRDTRDNSVLPLTSLSSSTSTSFSLEGTTLGKFPFDFQQAVDPRLRADSKIPMLTEGRILQGTITESLISDSYTLLLNGDSLSYRELWNIALSSMARPETVRYAELSSVWQRQINYPMEISVQAAGMKQASIDGIQLNIDQDHLQSDIWRIRYYPSRKGWHTLKFSDTGGIDSIQFYVGPEGWKRMIAWDRQKRNEHLDQRARSSISGVSSEYFWIVVLGVCLVFLWAEPRFG